MYGRYITSQIIQNHDSDDGWEWGEAHQICLHSAYHYAKNRSEAEDIAQEALLRAWRRRSTLRDDGRRKEWLISIVRNEAFREHERAHPEPLSTIEFLEAVDDERVVDTVELADIRAVIGHLDARDRLLLRLRYNEDLTESAIARRLGCPEGTVKVRLHRMRHRLRQAIAEL